MILPNGLIRDIKTKLVSHKLHVLQESHSSFRKRLIENGWHKVDNRYVLDAHETWVKGEFSCIFPGRWRGTKNGWNTIFFKVRIQTGFTDYTKEEWESLIEKRKSQGYVIVDTYKINSKPTITFDKLFTDS